MKRHSISQSDHTAKHIAVMPVLALLFAATLWGIFWYPLRLFEQAGLGGLWASFFIYSGTLVVAIPILLRRRHEWQGQYGWTVLLLLAVGWCNLSFILAVLDGQIMRVLLLFYLAPLWATLLGWWWLKESIDRQALLVLVMALLGALVMLWDNQLGFPYPGDLADWMAISSGLTFAIGNLAVRKLQHVSVVNKASCGWLGVWILAGIALMLNGEILEAGRGVIYSAMATGMGIVVIMTLSVMYGVGHMPLHRSSVILLFELVAGALSAYLLTDERMLIHEWIGGGLVVMAAYISAYRKVEE